MPTYVHSMCLVAGSWSDVPHVQLGQPRLNVVEHLEQVDQIMLKVQRM